MIISLSQKLREAVDSLYRQTHVNPQAYARLVLDCVRLNDAHQAKRLQSHMEQHLYEPTTTFIHNRLLHVYANSCKLLEAQNLFDKLPQRDIYTYNAMLKAYSKTGSVDDLHGLLKNMPCRDSVSYNTVITGLASRGCTREALEVFVKMQKEGFEVTGHTYVSVLNACSQVSNLGCGKQVHGKIVASGLVFNGFICNALTDLYAKCGEIDVARWLFDCMSNKSVVSWNLMIAGYMKNGLPEKCVELFCEMKLSGLVPDKFTVSKVLGAFFQTGRMDEAKKLFAEVEEKDAISWTTMIVGHVQNGKEEDALVLFGEMLMEHGMADKFTISSVVSSCARLASLFYGQAIHGRAVHMGVDNDTLVSSALVDMYSKCGEPSEAWKIFTTIHAKTVVSWNCMILGYAQNGKDLEALRLYEEMLNNNIKPDSITFVGVLSACIHERLTDRGEHYFCSMTEEYGIIPTLDHYACMINLVGHSGDTEKAVEIIKGMPYKPNSLIWSTLLSVCKLNGNIEHGEMAAKHLFEVEPYNAEPYITLSNLYAVNGRWKDMAAIRSLMNTKNIKKFAAFSWVEIDGKVHKFVSEDRTHPESKAIYRGLNRLIRKLLKSGFTPNKNLVLHDVGDDEKFQSICYHSEKLALVYGLMRKPEGRQPVRIIKNIRVCGDCHVFMKFVSKMIDRTIILRDSNRFHHFVRGSCSCKDLW
ncbi:pentatricopeptide repeat-containing protein At3g62890-like isoform X1 [Cynara cardunculus var. scolymus]|uniref:pentatricopeptide repeat-containing protein At3g62890-like isoform X1 n=1 Tax=Cynara cardunculus var. scolymus TaxID=59895 RepID=UPI000D62F231|nr:pentatricopeptide repeat-containing protein At3g62890-like isoform X1 [Cynara cardunculus var. scolymus]XP_024960498.1 pentatricopeptide repeat-containing protein At3g62890-like isoform X1 [Cynara cardunculus var. scolymus]XP_024960499.1 pentatricopeptide repeat-containing protein At3g62890-like isoform X1 [Cynara cardunculus var. scolymus]